MADIARRVMSSLGESRRGSVTWRGELAVLSFVASTCAG